MSAMSARFLLSCLTLSCSVALAADSSIVCLARHSPKKGRTMSINKGLTSREYEDLVSGYVNYLISIPQGAGDEEVSHVGDMAEAFTCAIGRAASGVSIAMPMLPGVNKKLAGDCTKCFVPKESNVPSKDCGSEVAGRPADDGAPVAEQQPQFSNEYERLINDYVKYLSGVPKEVKDEELKYLEEVSKIDKEMLKLGQQKVALKFKLSDALKEHQATKLTFDKKLYLLSKNSSYRPSKKPYDGKKKLNQKKK